MVSVYYWRLVKLSFYYGINDKLYTYFGELTPLDMAYKRDDSNQEAAQIIQYMLREKGATRAYN